MRMKYLPNKATSNVVSSMAKKAAELYDRLCGNTDPEVARQAYYELYENAWEGFKDDYEADVKKANAVLFKRYKDMSDTIKVVCERALLDEENFTLDKHSRWLGYVQGVLITEGKTTVTAERDFSRELFQTVYKKYGIEQDTIGV